ncbi:MAG: hypothetical protein ACRDGQ_01895, partial [Candidatus Limnocylindrales bacterium]
TVDPTPGPSTFQAAPEVPFGSFPPTWTVSGASTRGGSENGTTYFNDPGSPILHAGPVTIIVACIGSGHLTVALGTASGPGGSPVTFATGETQAVDCNEASGPVTAQLASPATGRENAVSVDGIPADPTAGFSWSLALGQPSR